MLICAERYQQCESYLKKRFDLKDVSFYQHSSPEGPNGSKDSQKVNIWINKCGGTVRFGIGDSVDIVIVEMIKLKGMIESYILWHAKMT